MVAKARRIKYYKKGGKIPKKYANNKFDNKGRMIDSNGDHVVANPRTIGTARYLTINGQQLYNARMSPHMRSKIVNAVKESYMPYVKNVKQIKKLPVTISLDFYDTTRQANWDLDNQWLYGKCFQDLIVKLGILPDDDIKYITQASAPRFFPVDTEEERKLIFHITTETRVEILKHKFYDTFYRKGK